MANATGLSQSTVGRIWRAFGLKPDRGDKSKLSNNPYFAEKLRFIRPRSWSPRCLRGHAPRLHGPFIHGQRRRK
jgi:hypothetical protein